MGWIKTIADSITNAVNNVRKPFPKIPPYLLLCEVGRKPGLSAMMLASAIISRLPEAGIETGSNRDGSPNKFNMFVRIMSEEIVRHFRENANIQMAIRPGGISVHGVGANAGGPVDVIATNDQPITGEAIVN